MSNPFLPVGPANNSFLPEDYIARKAETRVNILILFLFAIVLSSVFGAFMVTKRRWQAVREREFVVQELTLQEGQKIEQLKVLEEKRGQMMEKAQITSALVERVPRWALLAEVTFRMPDTMRLDLFQVKSTRIAEVAKAAGPAAPAIKSLTDKLKGENQKKKDDKPKVVAPKFNYTITISGAAEHNNDVATYLTSLKECPALDKVELAFINEVKEKESTLRKFEISAVIRQDADTEKLASSLSKLVQSKTEAVASKLPVAPGGNVAPKGLTADPDAKDAPATDPQKVANDPNAQVNAQPVVPPSTQPSGQPVPAQPIAEKPAEKKPAAPPVPGETPEEPTQTADGTEKEDE
jgi:Tfp pilus assembly protein PilN